MRQWIRFWGLGAVIVIALTWYLCIDWIVKASIETLATKANGAKVELNSATLTLWPTSLKLAGLQVTNPDAPMTNLFSAGEISTQLDGLMLLRRQLIIDNATLNGLSFNSPRSSSGKTLKVKTADDSDDFFDGIDLGGVIPGFSLPDTDQILKKEEAYLKAEVNEIESRLKTIEQRWQDNIKNLPDDDKLDEYKQRWKTAKKGNFLEKLNTLNSIKDDLDKDLKLISSLEKQLAKDQQQIKTEIDNAKSLPAREADRLMTSVGLGGGEGGFMSAITGAQVKQWLQQGLALFKQLSTKMQASSDQPAKPKRGEGLWVKFPEQNPLPQVLVRKFTVSGELGNSGNTIRFDGKGSDFAFPATAWKQAAKLALSGNNAAGASVIANAVFDHRQSAFNDQLQLDVNNFALNDLILSDKSDLKLTLAKARTTVKGNVSLTPATIDLSFNGQFNQVSLLADSDNPSTSQRVIAETLASVEQFNLALSASGDITAPTVKLKSNLDSVLGKSLKKQVGAQTDKLKLQLQQKIQQQLSGELGGLSDKADYLQNIEQLIEQRQQAFKEAGKTLK
ncbi:TIGR03545 family protein [Oceanicoccus sp. KOV_DT_Chl]|uniref:TIGR03545 family protein n=1 Tax=Oceanicoccus sp. KOV_DT_Chl TaxID=1904639 RepID=UPI000C7E66F1|nr:TIGR03545 family protein [Oceanicoccus sp. KOV_DT_Chl]